MTSAAFSKGSKTFVAYQYNDILSNKDLLQPVLIQLFLLHLALLLYP